MNNNNNNHHKHNSNNNSNNDNNINIYLFETTVITEMRPGRSAWQGRPGPRVTNSNNSILYCVYVYDTYLIYTLHIVRTDMYYISVCIHYM